MSIIASLIQRMMMDDQRTEQCKHPHALGIEKLIFLSCHRCGCLFVEGVFKQIDIIREEDEQNGETHASSYATEGEPVPVMYVNCDTTNRNSNEKAYLGGRVEDDGLFRYTVDPVSAYPIDIKKT